MELKSGHIFPAFSDVYGDQKSVAFQCFASDFYQQCDIKLSVDHTELNYAK